MIHPAASYTRPHISSSQRIGGGSKNPAVSWISFYKRTGNISEGRPVYRYMTNTTPVPVSPGEEWEESGIASIIYFEQGRWYAGATDHVSHVSPFGPLLAHLRENSTSSALCPSDTMAWARNWPITVPANFTVDTPVKTFSGPCPRRPRSWCSPSRRWP